MHSPKSVYHPYMVWDEYLRVITNSQNLSRYHLFAVQVEENRHFQAHPRESNGKQPVHFTYLLQLDAKIRHAENSIRSRLID